MLSLHFLFLELTTKVNTETSIYATVVWINILFLLSIYNEKYHRKVLKLFSKTLHTSYMQGERDFIPLTEWTKSIITCLLLLQLSFWYLLHLVYLCKPNIDVNFLYKYTDRGGLIGPILPSSGSRPALPRRHSPLGQRCPVAPLLPGRRCPVVPLLPGRSCPIATLLPSRRSLVVPPLPTPPDPIALFDLCQAPSPIQPSPTTVATPNSYTLNE
jgi:hypothetical protein